jgi:hypothetical protein
MGWIHAGNSESTSDGGAGYTRNASAVRDIVKHHDVDEKTAWALVALFSWQKSATIPDQVADSDYVSKWIDFPYFQAFLPVFQKYGWTSKVERFLESWIYHNQEVYPLSLKDWAKVQLEAVSF